MSLPVKKALILTAFLAAASFCQWADIKPALIHPVAMLDSASLELLPIDSLERLLDDYADCVSDGIDDGLVFYPCEGHLFLLLSRSSLPYTPKQRLYMKRMIAVCTEFQEELGFWDRGLVSHAYSRAGSSSGLCSSRAEMIEDYDATRVDFCPSRLPTLFVQDPGKAFPIHWLASGLYPVGLSLLIASAVGLKSLHGERFIGVEILYFFDIVVMAAGGVAIGGATATIALGERRTRRVRERALLIDEIATDKDVRVVNVRSGIVKDSSTCLEPE